LLTRLAVAAEGDPLALVLASLATGPTG